MKIEALGYIKEGGLKILNRKRFEADLKEVKDCDVEVIVKKRGKRSSPQNRYYWSCVVDEIRRELKKRGTRATAEEVHEALKLKFNPVRVGDKESGEVLLEIGGTTTAMNKTEFAEYLDRIIEWANTSLEIVIPEAGEQTKMFTE
jgi:hypothetical protein